MWLIAAIISEHIFVLTMSVLYPDKCVCVHVPLVTVELLNHSVGVSRGLVSCQLSIGVVTVVRLPLPGWLVLVTRGRTLVVCFGHAWPHTGLHRLCWIHAFLVGFLEEY